MLAFLNTLLCRHSYVAEPLVIQRPDVVVSEFALADESQVSKSPDATIIEFDEDYNPAIKVINSDEDLDLWLETDNLLPKAHLYAKNGDIKKLEALLTKYPERVLRKDHAGWMPLHHALDAGHIDVVDYLLRSMDAFFSRITLNDLTKARKAVNIRHDLADNPADKEKYLILIKLMKHIIAKFKKGDTALIASDSESIGTASSEAKKPVTSLTFCNARQNKAVGCDGSELTTSIK